MSAMHIMFMVKHVDWTSYCDEAVKRSQEERARHTDQPQIQLVPPCAADADEGMLLLSSSDENSDGSEYV